MKQIVIIDDDPGVQDVFTLIFSARDFNVSIYRNASQVFNEEAVVPDIYIIDKQLSGVDGLDICRFLKSRDNTANVPVIMMSASPNIHQLAKIAGADNSIEKPFSIKVLRALVNSLVKV